MSTLTTKITRTALALCLAAPLAAMAVTTTGYEDFGDTAGVILWRGTENDFHASTVADVAADGTVGEEYTMNTAQWHRFASNQTQYSSPGVVLVYDSAGTDQGYKYNPDCSFTPLSFGGMWVKTLAINGQPFSILGSGTRNTEFGASGESTLFKFDASYTINRTGTTTFFGDATVDIAQGATFTAQANSSHVVAVDSAATLKLKGAGTLAVTTMNVNGTLDLTETTRPTIDGNVNLYGTIVLPEGTEVSSESPFAVCTGTLSGLNVLVKIGNAEAVEKSFTAVNGAITAFADPIYVFTENYPTVVPAGQTYTFVGGDSAEEPVTITDTINVAGTLKTSGFITLPYKATAATATLDVIDGTTTLNAAGQAIYGTVTVREGATIVNTTTDAISYGTAQTTVNVYGTIDMGNSRWTLKNVVVNMYGGTVTGEGQSTNGALDFISEDNFIGCLNAYSNSTISASIKFRNALIPVTVDENVTLTLSGVIRTNGSTGGVAKNGKGNLTFTTAPTLPAGIAHSDGHLVFNTESDVNLTTTYSAEPSATTSLWYSRQSNWKGTVVLDYAITGVENGSPFKPTTYGNVNSTVCLKQGATNIYLANDAGNGPFSEGPKLYFKGNVSLKNGWAYDQNQSADLRTNETVIQQLGADEGVVFTTRVGGNRTTYFKVSSLKDFAGTIAVSAFTDILIENVDLAELPAEGALVVKATKANETTSKIAGSVTVGSDTVELVYDTVNDVSGLYAPVPQPATVTVTVPVVANTTVAVTADGDPVAPTSEGANTYEVDYGAEVVVTYAVDADAYEVVNGTIEFTATESTEVTAPTVTPYVAWIYDSNDAIIGKYKQVLPAVIAFGNGTGEKARFAEALDQQTHEQFLVGCSYDSATITYTRLPTVAVIISASGVWTNKYSTIAAAVGDAAAGDTITLVDDVALAESVEVVAGKSITIDLNGNAITGPAGDYAFSNAGELTIENGTITGAGGVAENTADGASIAVSSGSYTATGDLFANVEGATIAVSGGTFNKSVDEEYLVDGYEVTDNGDGTYGVREDKGWIYAAQGYWNYTGAWTGVDVDSSAEAVTIETNATYMASRPSDGQLVTFEMTASFGDVNEDASDFGDAKAAIRLAAGETDGTYQFQLYTSDGANKVWTNATVDVTATKETDYTFVLVFDLTNKTYTASIVSGATTNALSIGESITAIPFAYQGEVTPVQTINFVGSGTVSSIEGSYETPEEPPVPEGFIPADKVEIDGDTVELTSAQATWLNACTGTKAAKDTALLGLDATAFDNAYLLNLDITSAEYDGTFTFEVTEFDVGDAVVTVKVALTREGEIEGPINGTLKLTGTDALGNGFEEKDSATISDDKFSAGDGEVTITFTKDANTKFFKPVIE